MPAKLPGHVTTQENVVFGTGGGRELHCDVFTPPDDVRNRTAILIVHGGGWWEGDRTQLKGYGVQLARYGFLCVTSEYRLSREAIWPAQIHDVNAAVRWMRANSDVLGIDQNKICVSGNSAGGHLALMAAAQRPEFEGDGGNAGVSSTCAAIIAIYPPTLLRAGNAGDALHALFGGKVDRAIEDAASPLTHARGNFPPTMLIHGNADTVVPVSASFEMYQALAKSGAPVELHVYDGLPHGFDATPEFGHQVTDLIALFVDRKVRRAV